jgi:hypothetical protein
VIGLPRKLALDEVEIIGDRREISARPVGLSQREWIVFARMGTEYVC